ncbi:MAG: CRISPR-associated endoribonuclease Cas6 [Clostridia bacterium]|nr:CRISPR-associated endoribonuclease Cas6 [Clostridia bacterium]
MKLEIEFSIDKNKSINLNYNYYITSAIYNLIYKHNIGFSKQLHDEGYKIGNKTFKLFVYSRLMPDKYIIQGANMIIKKGKMRLYVNSPVKEFVNSLGNSLIKEGKMQIGEETFNINNIYLEDNNYFDYRTKFKVLSPIVVTTADKINGVMKPRTVHITEDKYIENIKSNLLKKYFIVKGKLPGHLDIDISFDTNYLKKSKRGNLIDFKGVKIKGYICPFTMECDSDLKKLAVDCGLGENNSIGMGYITEQK